MQSKKKIYKPWYSEKPYNFFGDYLWKKYGVRVLKLPIDAGFTCPNKDGSIVSTGVNGDSQGCIFCASDGAASPSVRISGDIEQQMENARRGFTRSEASTKYIAYFQPFTNTYSNAENLKNLYDRAVQVKDVTGLMIATRPDCLPDKILDLIASYAKEGFELCLEIGMQTMHDKSLAYLNRGHSYADVKDAVYRAEKKHIPVCVHVILCIPGESWKDMMNTAREISSLPVSGIKIHHLHVIKGTKLEEYYNNGKARVPEFREYVSIICDFIERLRPDILIHRLIGDKAADSIIAPKWALDKGTVVNAITDEFFTRGTFQGFLIENLP